MSESFYAVVLAAGKGKRMKSTLPKVLHKLRGKPLIDYVLGTVLSLSPAGVVVVVGFGRELVMEHIRRAWAGTPLEFVVQKELLGTADAVRRALDVLPQTGDVVVLCGDVPLISPQTIRKMLSTHASTGAAATILTALLDDPKEYGRIIRAQDGSVEAIVEHKDATPQQRLIKEINAGTYVFRLDALRDAIKDVRNENAQGEFYLTDVVHILRGKGLRVSAVVAEDRWEVEGVNSPAQLAALEEHLSSLSGR